MPAAASVMIKHWHHGQVTAAGGPSWTRGKQPMPSAGRGRRRNSCPRRAIRAANRHREASRRRYNHRQDAIPVRPLTRTATFRKSRYTALDLPSRNLSLHTRGSPIPQGFDDNGKCRRGLTPARVAEMIAGERRTPVGKRPNERASLPDGVVEVPGGRSGRVAEPHHFDTGAVP